MQRKNLVNGDLIEVQELESVVATVVTIPANRDCEKENRVLAYFKDGAIIEISNLEACTLKNMGIPEGTMDDIVDLVLYDKGGEIGHYINGDIDVGPEGWMTSEHSEVWTVRRCNVPLAVGKYTEYRKLMVGMEKAAIDLREGRVTQEEIEAQIKRAKDVESSGIFKDLDRIVEGFMEKLNIR